VHKFDEGFVYGLDKVQAAAFAAELTKDLGYPIRVCDTAEEGIVRNIYACVKLLLSGLFLLAVRASDVVFTQTPASAQVLQLSWLRPHATIIASGSDQPTKNELPVDVRSMILTIMY
jgi:ornithine cyclodeaminase/alanine dehydrogenase-like protein (mu-crystallin family)